MASLSADTWSTMEPFLSTPKPLKPNEAAYWPLWLNIAAPLLGTLIFALVQILLLRIDDPGLKKLKLVGKFIANEGAARALGDVEKAAINGEVAGASTAAAPMNQPSTSETGIQCELIRADHHHHHVQVSQVPPGAMRRRTSSAGSVPESDTMRLLEGMLLRPRRPLSRRRLSESEQERASESAGGGAAAAPGQSASAALPGVSVTQSLTGPGAKRFAAGLQHRLLAASRSQQQQQQQQHAGRKGSTSEV